MERYLIEFPYNTSIPVEDNKIIKKVSSQLPNEVIVERGYAENPVDSKPYVAIIINTPPFESESWKVIRDTIVNSVEEIVGSESAEVMIEGWS